MVTGCLPFEGETEHGVLYGIVNSQPEPLTALRVGVPVELDRIVGKAMAKNPAERYQHADEMLVDLRAVRNSLQPVSATTQVTGPAAPGGSLASRLWPTAALIAVIVAFLAGWLLRPTPEAPASSTPLTPTPLTTYPGQETLPTFSPEGDRVAFAWEGPNRDNWDIYLRLIGEDTLIRLTDDPAADTSPAWSPDGRRIAFVRNDDENATKAVLVVPAIGGGRERAILKRPLTRYTRPYPDFREHGRLLAWHPDGVHLVASLQEEDGSPFQLYLLNADTGDTRLLLPATAANIGDSDPAVSPDGLRLAFQRSFSHRVLSVYVVDLTETLAIAGEPRNLTGEMMAMAPAWSPDGDEVIFSSTTAEALRLWRVSAEGGRPQPLAYPPGSRLPTLSATGNRGAFVHLSEGYDIWQFDLQGGEPKALIESTYFDVVPQFSPDGTKVAFSSARSGYREIWICDSDGSNPSQLTHLESRLTAQPWWSPDGSQIVFDSFVGNRREVFVVPSGGGSPKQLTNTGGRHASFSRDGRWIYFNSPPSAWKIPAEGGEVLPVSSGANVIESIDGQTLYFSADRSLWSMPVQGGDPTLVVEGTAGERGGWTVAEEGIYFQDTLTPRGLNFFDFQSKTVEHLLTLPERVFGLSVSPDGQKVLVSTGELPESDIMLVDEFR